MDIAVDLVFRAGFHLLSPFRQKKHAFGSPRRDLLLHSISCPTSEFQQPVKEGTIALQGNAQVFCRHAVALIPLLFQA
jgi:hypothetical protein